MLFTTRAKEITKQNKTDRRYSYFHKSRFVKEGRRVHVQTLLNTSRKWLENIYYAHLAQLPSEYKWMRTCICVLLLRHLARTSQTPIWRESSSGKVARAEITATSNWQLSRKLASAYHLSQDASLMTDCRHAEDTWPKRSCHWLLGRGMEKKNQTSYQSGFALIRIYAQLWGWESAK